MIHHLLKIIRAQWKSNIWIYAELLIVVCAVWWMGDQFYVDTRTYYAPLGYDITNSWIFEVDYLAPGAPEYVADEGRLMDGGTEMFQLKAQILQHPKVEDVCLSFLSAPYAFGNTDTGIEPVDGDTAALGGSTQCRYVTPEYFDMFRVKDIYGKEIAPQLEGVQNPIIVTEDMAQKFFHTRDVRGRQIKYPSADGERMTITAVSMPYRDNEYVRSEPFFYKIITPQNANGFFGRDMLGYGELCVRMKQKMSQAEMNEFLREMGDRLTVNNLYVYSASSIERYKEDQLLKTESEQSRKFSMMAFLLVNVFFGIVGTFWLRGQSRQAEVGLRIALGANKGNVRSFMYLEGMLLLLLTVPFSLLFAINMIYFDVPDTYRLLYTLGRFLITYGGSYLLMAGMIVLGIWFPVRKAEQVAPAEALLYE